MGPLFLAMLATVTPVGGGNALTLPAQRHLVRQASTWLLAVQKDGRDGHGLALYRSDDGVSWRFYAPIQDDWQRRDTADVQPDGDDLALAYSYEGPRVDGAHDVHVQWWRHRGGEWVADPPLQVFAGAPFLRAELARDSLGRWWLQAWRHEPSGAFTAVIAVSTDGGASFVEEPPLAELGQRGGGRLIASGSKLLFLYDSHDANGPARFRVRDDAAPLDAWSPEQTAFPEGIYHGAALSAAAAPAGAVDVVYKDKTLALWYRRFDGASFGAATLVEPPANWALQPAVTRIGGALYVFDNPLAAGGYQLRARVLDGGALGEPQILASGLGFAGYPAAAAELDPTLSSVPCLFAVGADASSQADAMELAAAHTPSAAPIDAGVPPDAATPATPTPSAPTDAAVTSPAAAPAHGCSTVSAGPISLWWIAFAIAVLLAGRRRVA